MTQLTTSGLSGELMAYLNKVFLERPKNVIVFKEGAQVEALPANSGTTMKFNRYTPLDNTPANQTLTEGVVPTPQGITASQVTATVLQYGGTVQISDFLNATSIDVQAKEKTELIAQQFAENIDNVIRNELVSGATVLYANSKASLTAVAATDVLTAKDVLRVRRNLEKNGAPKYDDGRFIGKIGPDTSFDLMQDTTWVNSHVYVDGTPLYNAEVGRLWNIRFQEANRNQYNEASTATVYSNLIHGKGAFATVDLENLQGGLFVHTGGKQDTYNPLEQFVTIGWKAAFAAKTLNANFIYNLKTGASA